MRGDVDDRDKARVKEESNSLVGLGWEELRISLH